MGGAVLVVLSLLSTYTVVYIGLLSLLSTYIVLLVIGFIRNPLWALASVIWLIVSFLALGLIVAIGGEALIRSEPAVGLTVLGYLSLGPTIALLLSIIGAARRPAAHPYGRPHSGEGHAL